MFLNAPTRIETLLNGRTAPRGDRPLWRAWEGVCGSRKVIFPCEYFDETYTFRGARARLTILAPQRLDPAPGKIFDPRRLLEALRGAISGHHSRFTPPARRFGRMAPLSGPGAGRPNPAAPSDLNHNRDRLSRPTPSAAPLIRL